MCFGCFGAFAFAVQDQCSCRTNVPAGTSARREPGCELCTANFALFGLVCSAQERAQQSAGREKCA